MVLFDQSTGLDIPTYNYDDFNTEEPYKLIYSMRQNRFQMNRLTNIIAKNATEVNYKGFRTMLKSYRDTMERPSEILANVTRFSGQPLELCTGDWTADDEGITRTNANFGEDIACVHPIEPVERLVNADTGIEKLKIAFRRGLRWKYAIYEKKILSSNNSIVELSNAGVAVNSENARHLVRYLHDVENLNYDQIPTRTSVGRLGWMEEGFSPYVEALEFDGIDNFRNMFESVQQCGNFDVWLSLVREIRQTDSPARVILAASFASCLIKPLQKLNFIVHLWGGTEVGKTVALMLAASVWANPQTGADNGYIQTFNGTQVAIELQCGFVNNMPLIMDEFQLVKDAKSFEKTVYMLCEGIGRIRGAKTGGLQKTTTWKNCTITSGETPISSESSGGGAVNRIIEIECRDKVFDDAPKVADAVSNNYGHAGKMFVDLLSREGQVEDAVRIYKKYYRLVGHDSTEKQAMAAAVILTADELATKWIFHDERNLAVEDMNRWLQTKDVVDVNRRAYDYILDVVDGNRSKFLPDNPEQWGYISDDGYINMFPRNFKKILEEGGYNPSALRSWLKQRGYSRTDEDRTDKTMRHAGKVRKFISFALSPELVDSDGFKEIIQEELPF